MNTQELDQYIQAVRDLYEASAKEWSITNRDPIVGSFDDHNMWKDYQQFLFGDIVTTDMIALDYGCGPARNAVLFQDRFKRIDGADILLLILEKAKEWISHNKLVLPNLYLVDGRSLTGIPTNAYDMVFSTICFQHIGSYSARLAILKDIYKVLKPSGYVCVQMGFGGSHQPYHTYYEDKMPNLKTFPDVSVQNPEQVANDLTTIGFTNFKYSLRPTGPQDGHQQWIFFSAQKPA